MSINSLATFFKDALVDLAAQVVEALGRKVAGWFMEQVERLAGLVATKLRDYAQRRRAAGEDERRVSGRISDALLQALDALRADILRRRETLTAEQAVSLFEQQMSMPQLA